MTDQHSVQLFGVKSLKDVGTFQEFELALKHVENLLDRRQTNTSFYLSVNTGILAAIRLLLKDSQLTEEWLLVSILLLVCAGFIACWIRRSLLRQYEILLDWWYARLRELEASIPDSARLASSCLETLLWQSSRLLWHPLTRPEASTKPILPVFGRVGPCNSRSER